ncbi:MAG: heme-binding protein [Gammaproteobacteria bacterium]|nr:heme-binding protein [Gammaproteobacteria bacterium]MDH3411798.1 heme-binding protein [Gammaproteobacteria bacterium]
MTDLSLEQAKTIVREAVAEGRRTLCAPLTVAVLDAGGHLKCFAREDGSGILRGDIATAKAWGALGMGFGSRTLHERAMASEKSRTFFNALSDVSGGRVVPVPGGVLIRDVAGEIVGAVGISGDTSEKDEACAIYGIEAAKLRADPG